jgi:hypothetical protein
LLLQGFYYANGVALSPDEDFLVMCETDRVRVLKYWLKGPKVCHMLPSVHLLDWSVAVLRLLKDSAQDAD